MDASQEVPPDPAMENELTEEDLFRMKGLSVGRGSASLVTSETAEQSIISLADSSSNFDEHVGDEFDEVETVDDGEDIDSQSRIFNGWLFSRKRQDNALLNKETVTVLQFPRDLPIPPCPTSDEQEEWEKAFRQATVYLIGTAHFSKDSQEDVVNTIKATQPDMVMIELCPGRLSILSMDEETLLREASDLNTQKIMNTIKTSGTVLGILHVLLLSMSAHITRQLSMAPGGEFRAAHKAVMQTQLCRLVLGDRPIQITLQRALGSLSFWQKIKFMCHVAVSHFTPITPEEIEKCKKRDLLEELLAEMAGDFPKLTKIFVDERDAYMSHALHTLLLRNTVEKRTTWLRNRHEAEWQPINVVSVVGIGHTPGIIANWNTPVDISPLIELPPPSVSGMIIRYSFKLAFYGAVGFLIYKGGSRIARRFVKCEMSVLNELWTIDCHALFQNYNNFTLWRKADAGSFGALLYGRPSKKMIVQVFFIDVESLNAGNVEFLTSAVSPDLEMVGNLAIEGYDVPLLGSGFSLNATKEILDNSDIHGFFDLNGMLNATQMTNEGLSLWTKVGFECNVRTGRETTDLRSSAERFLDNVERIMFINQDKGIILRPTDEKSVTQKILDEHAKGATQYKDMLEFQAVHSLTRNTKNDSDDQKMVPIVRITRDGTSYMNVSCVLLVVIPAFPGEDSKVLYERFREGVRRRIQNMVYVSINGLKKQKELLPTTSYVFMPPSWSSFLHLQLPNWPDSELKAYRQRLHKLFNLTPSAPCLRNAQHITFGGAASCKLLRSPHLSITNYKSKGVVSTVKGPYNYHHYMQDNFDDSGWGCAYRSFQTIWSWFVLNGYTDKPVPNHREIQQCLVNIGDKEDKFVGSRQWIGSTEIGFVLETLLGIESKFIITNSGGEVPERTRELARHFETAGSPVMIGGAQLAHTILGVDFDENSGECKFLILDPHYTGSEDLRAVLSKGWCAWKPASFWKPDHFYNMVLPQPPVDAI